MLKSTENRYKFKSKPKNQIAESHVNQTLSTRLYSIYCIRKYKKYTKIGKMNAKNMNRQYFFRIFVRSFDIFARFCLFFRDFSFLLCDDLRFFFFHVQWEEMKKNHLQKWTLISFKLQKNYIVLFCWCMQWAARTLHERRTQSYCMQCVCVCGIHISMFNVQMLEIWYAWRASSTNIKCNLFYWNFLPCHFARHWSIALMYAMVVRGVPTCSFYDIVQSRIECGCVETLSLKLTLFT